jgi:hypothetical protein
MDTIDLGRKSGGGPSIPVDPTPKHYPTLYIDLDADVLGDIPECGTMEVYFRTVSKTVTDRDGEKTVSVSLEIQKILDIEEDEEEEPANDRKKAEKALDSYANDESEKD